MSDGKFLIKSEEVIYTIVDGALVDTGEVTLTSQVFQDYGIDDSSILGVAGTLVDPKIYYWEADETSTTSMTATMHSTPDTSGIIGNMDMRDPNITGVDFVTAEFSGSPKLAIAFGNKYRYYDVTSSTWKDCESINDGTLLRDIITLDDLVWKAETQRYPSIGFANVRVVLTSLEDTVTNVTLHFN